MAFSLSVSAITPPEGLQHTDRRTEILELPSYLRVTGASGSSELKLVYVGATTPGPENIDNVWLKIDESGTAHGFYLYDTTLGTWLLMAGPGVISGTTVPTDTNVLWLKTDDVDAILTPEGSAVTAPQGLYKFNGTLWVCFTTTTNVVAQASAPTGATTLFWLKTTDATTPRGLHYWNGTAWVNATAMPGVSAPGSGVGAAFVQTSALAPDAAIRNYVLWAKTGNAPRGLFWPDSVNGWWESINPITFSRIFPASGVITLASGYTAGSPGIYSTLCPTIGTAVFAEIPMLTVMLESDTLFGTSGAYLSLQAQPTLSGWGIAAYNAGAQRDVIFRLSVAGIMRIPF
jgi:hypothetical protein